MNSGEIGREGGGGGVDRPIEGILEGDSEFLFRGEGNEGKGSLRGAVIGEHAENAPVLGCGGRFGGGTTAAGADEPGESF